VDKSEAVLKQLLALVDDEFGVVGLADALGFVDEELWHAFDVTSAVGPLL
jgi:hypothetical protein